MRCFNLRGPPYFCIFLTFPSHVDYNKESFNELKAFLIFYDT